MEAPVAQQFQAFLTQFTPIKWSTPRDLEAHRQELTRRINAGDLSPYTMPFEFPDVDAVQASKLGQDVLRRLDEVPAQFRAVVEAEIAQALMQLQLIQARDDDALNAWTIDTHGLPSIEVTHEADWLLQQPLAHPEEGMTMSCEAVATAMRDALRAYELGHWSVRIDPNMSANASVLGRKSTVKISRNAQPTIDECRRLVAHEIGGHVLRWENARRQPTPWAQFGFGITVPTEEGLAALVEEELGVATTYTQRRYAVRVSAVHASRTRDLLELAFYLATLLPAAEAAALALRIRRGISSPKSTGGLTKDHGYLSGLLVSRRLADNDPEGLNLLRGTKWSVDYLPLARKLAADGCLIPALLVPTTEALGLEQITNQ